MNKTVKTIAWICLVLGLMGLAIDVGVYVRGRALVTQIQERFESGDFPAFEGHFADIDEDGDIDRDDMEAWRSDDTFGFGGMRGGTKGFGSFGDRDGFAGRMFDGRFTTGTFGLIGLPLFFLAAGPVLTVVGAVMLIVNREPKVSTEKKKTTKSKKS